MSLGWGLHSVCPGVAHRASGQSRWHVSPSFGDRGVPVPRDPLLGAPGGSRASVICHVQPRWPVARTLWRVSDAVDEMNPLRFQVDSSPKKVASAISLIVSTLHSNPSCFREIVEHMVQHFKTQIFGDRKPVFDGRKNLYTAMPLPIGREKVSWRRRAGSQGVGERWSSPHRPARASPAATRAAFRGPWRSVWRVKLSAPRDGS